MIWRGMKMSSFADSTLCSTMTSLWFSLEHQETALRSKESMSEFLPNICGGIKEVFIHLTLIPTYNV